MQFVMSHQDMFNDVEEIFLYGELQEQDEQSVRGESGRILRHSIRSWEATAYWTNAESRKAVPCATSRSSLASLRSDKSRLTLKI